MSESSQKFQDKDESTKLNEKFNNLALYDSNNNKNVKIGDKIISQKNAVSFSLENLPGNKASDFKKISINQSQNIHIGNTININGPIFINELSATINTTIEQKNQKSFPIVSRRVWVAQPPVDPSDVICFKKVPKFVIINHSATEEGYSQTENNYQIRLIQQFHVESLKWNDIAYNFLVGADGSIYEGRGWNVVGAHTYGYNRNSIGICFVGYYMKSLPPRRVLDKVKDFVKYGVEIGAIADDYSILGHCQCRSSENPGRMLFEELKTWEKWDASVDLDHPSPLIQELTE